MTYEVNFIRGQKGAICNNDSYSVVDTTPNDHPKVLAFIPTEGRSGLTAQRISEAFEAAHENARSEQQLVATALRTLNAANSPNAPAA